MDKAAFLKAAASRRTEVVALPSGTGEVTVRSLTRAETESTKVKGDDAASEANLFAIAVTDPEMTPEEWRGWIDTVMAGDYVAVGNAIQEVSGIGVDAQKSGVRKVPHRRKR